MPQKNSRPRRLLALATDNWAARAYWALLAAGVAVGLALPENPFGAVPLLLTAPLSTLAIAMPPVGDTLAAVLAAVWLLLSALGNAAVVGALAHRTRAARHA
ncbi:hypothetical protein Stsp02_48470 [Streptomyces sp. NBRC 14336]|uniref:SCO4225 family membrane protein n=1 Tax=Streptomyces sp. NBRC 14336 TaxID=3030992 RepID=UPI0024A56F31|nr:hypothetical protein [Streptomyces sp. NBRC 14336]GLW49186.1 hypothetical protein Stsp02_48470 [Streptomyces sp. NBRC 14336]